ncbi:hypothetical protein BGZ60DRAFT_424366 [Tricladium varicosporioides]|nr:hypothetical protein BGZ60DRAFT_424366 [Hymenoscyphus varicosporioides]
MGSSVSKGASSTLNAVKIAPKHAPANTVRKYPTRPPPTSLPHTNIQELQPSPTASIRPTVYPVTHASSSYNTVSLHPQSKPESQSLEKDTSLAARLQQLGPVQPNSSTFDIARTSHLSSPNRSPSSKLIPNSSFPPSGQPPQHAFTPSTTSAPSQPIFPVPASNPAISLLTARYRLAADAEREFENTGRKGAKGKEFLDVTTLRQVLVMRGKGMSEAQIEETLELGKGVVRRLGGRGVVEAAGGD